MQATVTIAASLCASYLYILGWGKLLQLPQPKFLLQV